MPYNNGIPTADEEALQAPAIDPISLLAMAPTFGMGAAAGNGIQQGLFAAMMGHGNRLNSLPGPPPQMADDMMNRAAGKAADLGEQGFLQPSGYGEFLKNLFGHFME